MNRDDLIAQYLAGEKVENELMEACSSDAEFLDELTAQVAVDRLLDAQSEVQNTSFKEQLLERIKAEESSLDKNKNTDKNGLLAQAWFIRTAVAAAVVIASLLMFRIQQRTDRIKIVDVAGAVWSENIPEQGWLKQGELNLDKGFAQLELPNGVVLTLEGPVKCTVKTLQLVELYTGKLVAYVPENAIGFTVTTPSSEIVDLGTEFGVSVDPQGGSEVHVIDGEVKARAEKNQAFEKLQKDEALSFDLEKRVVRITSRPEIFMRALPGKSPESPQYLHWSFDDGGDVLECRGTGFDGRFYPGRMKTVDGGEGPQFVEGVVNQALYFNGIDAYVDTEFEGIGGNKPRTLAFWLKVPQPFAPNQSYGIMGWGYPNKGGAWQISPNPAPGEGGLSHLRVGTFQAAVVGTTPLADNQWHHIAVVMYGGKKVSTATHVLIYVDGKLEQTINKSITRIDTNLSHKSARPLRFGCNMAFLGMLSKKSKHRVFFKGWLDEVFIFEAALDQKQIQNIMNKNALK